MRGPMFAAKPTALLAHVDVAALAGTGQPCLVLKHKDGTRMLLRNWAGTVIRTYSGISSCATFGRARDAPGGCPSATSALIPFCETIEKPSLPGLPGAKRQIGGRGLYQAVCRAYFSH